MNILVRGQFEQMYNSDAGWNVYKSITDPCFYIPIFQ